MQFRQILVSPESATIVIDSFSKYEARTSAIYKGGEIALTKLYATVDKKTYSTLAKRRNEDFVQVKDITIKVEGSKGFLGIGKKPNSYEVRLVQMAIAEVTYKSRVIIRAVVGENEEETSSKTGINNYSDIGITLIKGELIQCKGKWIRLGTHQQNLLAAIGCFIEWKLALLGNEFRAGLVFQNKDDMREFLDSKIEQRLVSMGGFRISNLDKANTNTIFGSLSKTNTLFLLTLPLLEAVDRASKLRVRTTKDTSGSVALWRPMPVILLAHNPSEIKWGKSIRSTKPCCVSFLSLMGLLEFICYGREAIL